jgi:hypothetical protein
MIGGENVFDKKIAHDVDDVTRHVITKIIADFVF